MNISKKIFFALALSVHGMQIYADYDQTEQNKLEQNQEENNLIQWITSNKDNPTMEEDINNSLQQIEAIKQQLEEQHNLAMRSLTIKKKCMIDMQHLLQCIHSNPNDIQTISKIFAPRLTQCKYLFQANEEEEEATLQTQQVNLQQDRTKNNLGNWIINALDEIEKKYYIKQQKLALAKQERQAKEAATRRS